MNVIARLEYELAYYDSAVNRFNHYTTRTPPICLCFRLYLYYGDTTILHFAKIMELAVLEDDHLWVCFVCFCFVFFLSLFFVLFFVFDFAISKLIIDKA